MLPREQAIAAIKKATEKTYERKGKSVVVKNFEAIDAALGNLFQVKVPSADTSDRARPRLVADTAPEFIRYVVAPIMALRGDELPVSALPVEGTYPTGTTQHEKRNIAEEVPVWDPDLCIQCGQCAVVCPRSVIRAKSFPESHLNGAPAEFKSAAVNARGYPESRYTLQVYVEDCTGCVVRHVKRTVRIPVSVKLPPFFSSPGNFSKQLESAGADGLVFFNQLFRPDLDIDTQTITAEPVLCTPVEIHVPLTWIALLSPHLELSLAAGGGVDSYVEVVKFLLAGADVVATTSALLRHGPQHMSALIEGLQRWLANHAFESVSQIRGHLNGTRIEPIDAFLRRQYAHSLGKHRLPNVEINAPTVGSQHTRRLNGARNRC